ncbi:hypothetical protein ROZALSC1DRAFT_29096 [Rozella allomycis CSF55]|uniref:Uncharacterized protein n=1 Tax=Rozella allomycis (strain CSF55) TaxID=988480 RepID=A0A4P9YIT0_ROZAC|nr:hypothetical protein ROZALSC1DRAFT_29096 [Rozella allomycis CSF55]
MFRFSRKLFNEVKPKGIYIKQLVDSGFTESQAKALVLEIENIITQEKLDELNSSAAQNFKVSFDNAKDSLIKLDVDMEKARSGMADLCNQAESGLELDINLEKKRTLDLTKELEEKVETIPYYMDKKMEVVNDKVRAISRVAILIPSGKIFSNNVSRVFCDFNANIKL